MTSRGKGGQQAVVAVLCAIFLAVTYLGMGYACCAGIPFVTEKVAYATIDDSGSPFDKEQLVEGALATRDYSFGSHDIDAYGATLRHMNEQAQTPYADASEIFDAPIEYSVDSEQISHLDDVNELASRMMMPILGSAAIAAFLLFAGFRMFGARAVSMTLTLAGAISAAVLLLLGVWAFFGFDGFFAAFHSVFFAEGTWTFPADSLLITMLPGPFWAGMGAMWLAASLLLSVVSILLGLLLRRRTCK